MKVLHFILGKANKDRANGVNQMIAGLAKYSVRQGAEVRVIGKAESVEYQGEIIVRDGFAVEAYSGWGKPLRTSLERDIKWADIVHLHGVYSTWNLLVARMCRKANRPYLITLHNGLSPESARVSGRLKKKVFHALLQRRHLESAGGIHVLTEEETTDLYAVAQPRNVFCIPNGIDLEDYPLLEKRSFTTTSSVTIGYLGRLSAEKNIDALCEAFVNVNTGGRMQLKLAGPPSDYGNSIKKRYSKDRVELVGPVYGTDKDQFIRDLDLFVIPSLSEGFSIAVAESLALRTPLLVSRTSKMAHLYDQRAFFMCEPTKFGLEQGLRLALSRCGEWESMADNGRRLIEERLNWCAVATEMLKAYDRTKGKC